VGYVLGKFAPEAKEIVAKVVSESIKASELIISKGGDVAMNAYNGWVA
jgi:peptidyl-tRNA hydrolase